MSAICQKAFVFLFIEMQEKKSISILAIITLSQVVED